MKKIEEKRVKAIPSSFVFRNLKLQGDSGSGEAKLHLGSAKNQEDIDLFFNNYDESNIYFFDKENLKVYLQEVKIEYIYQKINRYSDISLEYWQEKYSEIDSINESDLIFNITKFTDKSRYYIRSSEEIFKNTLRKIALPLISNIRIEKYEEDDKYKYLFLLELNTEYNQEGRTKEQDNTNLDKYNLTGENVVYYGAPGTGKSYTVNEKSKDFDYVERVTFYPEYTHDDFIGCFMPVMSYEKENTQRSYVFADNTPSNLVGKPVPYYTFVDGPFTKAFVHALKNPNENVLLIIEELNRANAAAVFGEIFQLLDRKYDGQADDGESRYEISISNEFSEFLSSQGVPDYKNGDKIKIPCNLSIYATMNSADQGVNPLDSAFKRRWNFIYVPIDFNEVEHKDYEIDYAGGKVTWETFATTINKQLKSKDINEDKHLGEYFVNKNEVSDKYKFASKILLYLFDDVLKFNRRGFFKPEYKTFSDLLEGFNSGKEIFDFKFEIKDVSKKEEVEIDMVKIDNGTNSIVYDESNEYTGSSRVAEESENEN